MKVYIKNRERRKGQFTFYMQQFVESCIKNGMKSKPEFYIYKGRSFLQRILMPLLKLFSNNNNFVIVSCSGSTILEDSFPYYPRYNIIPMIWDVWPACQEKMFDDLVKLKCQIVFVTVKSMADRIHKELGIKAYWIPEGIDINNYKSGEKLKERDIDIYELGRRHIEFHESVKRLISKKIIKKYKWNEFSPDGRLISLAFPTAEELLRTINKVKLLVCYPKTYTHPKEAGGLETLTQRYWEGMLSRCLIVGKAPLELIELIGYNPVVEVDLQNIDAELASVLENIEEYQDLVDKNYKTAQIFGSWDRRIELINNVLIAEGIKGN